jgi:hypothetical protein
MSRNNNNNNKTRENDVNTSKCRYSMKKLMTITTYTKNIHKNTKRKKFSTSRPDALQTTSQRRYRYECRLFNRGKVLIAHQHNHVSNACVPLWILDYHLLVRLRIFSTIFIRTCSDNTLTSTQQACKHKSQQNDKHQQRYRDEQQILLQNHRQVQRWQ